jgi:hypothetical protein
MSAKLALDGSLEAFFFTQVGEAQTRAGASLPRQVEAYVVHLLADSIGQTGGRRPPQRSLWRCSTSAPAPQEGSARAQALRQVGDRALFIAGVVPHSLDRTPSTCATSGRSARDAYRQVAPATARSPSFNDLADRFERAAEVISEATDARGEADRDLLGLYERWRRYGESRDARRLLAAGVVLGPDGSDILQ